MSDETTRARARAVAIVAGLVLGPCAPAVADAAAADEVVRLDELRAAPAVLTGGARPAELRLRFELPPGAKQGPDRWYRLRLRYRLWLAAESGRGFVWVTSDTNDRTAAQIEYTTRRHAGRLWVRRTTLDLERGQRELRSRSRRDTLTFTNYLQYAGVRPGMNTWTIRLEQAGAARVQRLEVLGDSAIVQTRRTPFPLSLTAVLEGDRPQVGERFTMKVVLAARAGQPVRDVVVRARSHEDAGVELVGSAARRIGALGGRPRAVRFSFLARRPGNHAITLVAGSDANDPNASVQVEVAPATRAESAPPMAWALASIPALAMAGWLLAGRRSRRDSA